MTKPFCFHRKLKDILERTMWLIHFTTCVIVQSDTGSDGCYSWREFAKPHRPREARHRPHCPELNTNLSYRMHKRFCYLGSGISLFPNVNLWFCRLTGQCNVIFWTNGSLKLFIYKIFKHVRNLYFQRLQCADMMRFRSVWSVSTRQSFWH